MKKRMMFILFSALAFIALIVALNSFVFSIKEVRADSYNSKDAQLETLVAEASGIKLYKNIITLNKNKAIQNIESEMFAVTPVKVVNIERKFPNKVWIHFVKLIPVLALETENGSGKYVTCDNNLMIVETGVSETDLNFDMTVGGVDKITDGEARPMVRVLIKGAVRNPEVKKAVDLTDPDALAALRIIVDTVNRLDYKEYDFVRLLKEIDLTKYDETVPDISLKMRAGGGASITIKIQNGKKLLLQKVQHAISAYDKYLNGELPFKNTTWTVFNNSKNKIIIEDS